MTVKELIKKLQEMPQDMTVVIDGYEGGVGTITEGAVRQTKIWEHVHSFPYKKIGEDQINTLYYDIKRRHELPTRDVVYISRFSKDGPDDTVFECRDYFGIHEIVRTAGYDEV